MSQVLILSLAALLLLACETAYPEPQLEVSPLGEQAGRWRAVTDETVKLTVVAPGAEQVKLFYRPVDAIDRHVELRSFSEKDAPDSGGRFTHEWRAGEDLGGEVWAEVIYDDGMKKEIEPIAIAHESAIKGSRTEVPIDSIGRSASGDESERADKLTGGKIEQAELTPGNPRIWLTVNVPAFRLTLWQEGREIRTYQIGIGRRNFPLPVGERKATEIVWNPAWIPPSSSWVLDSGDVEPGERIEADDPRNPLGKIKIRLGDAVLIHEAAKPSDIGRLVSHGCIRMLSEDIFDLAGRIVEARSLPVTPEQIERARTSDERVAARLDPPIWVDINYDTEVIEGGSIHLYPDVYRRNKDLIATLRAELEEAGVAREQLSDETLKAMRERVRSDEKFVVRLDDLKAGQALTSGRTEPLTDQSMAGAKREGKRKTGDSEAEKRVSEAARPSSRG